ncbi:unnamed protein product [Mytilus edulis]|uniref:Uncharacterized protein n=1 Tax=Mytilus edulis TaxID=6550 RepID=A0A8S3V8U2_MYTED|nr:unnamed protein product [Mytilus edulis]
MVLRRSQAFGCGSSNSGQQLTSNDSFYRMVLPMLSEVLQNDAADTLKRLAVAVLIVDNNSSLIQTALKCFYRMVLRGPQAFGCSSSNSGQQLTSNDSFLQNGAAGSQAFGCSSSNSGQQLTSNDSFYRMVLRCPQTFDCSSSNSGQQLTSNDSFLQNGAA